MAEKKMIGHPVAGIFGYSHLTGDFAGAQSEYARVPFADVNWHGRRWPHSEQTTYS